MEIHIAGFNRTRVSAHRTEGEESGEREKNNVVRRRACLCRAVPCCHSEPSKTYNFEEAKQKKKSRNKWLTIITYRSVCSCAKRQCPSALLIWNWHCNDRNNHQISSLKEKEKKTQNSKLHSLLLLHHRHFFFLLLLFFFRIELLFVQRLFACIDHSAPGLAGVGLHVLLSAQIQYKSRTYTMYIYKMWWPQLHCGIRPEHEKYETNEPNEYLRTASEERKRWEKLLEHDF